MNNSARTWIGPAVAIGLLYAVVGVAFAWPSTHVRAWRLAAWAVSASAYAVHIWYERYRLGNSLARSAAHVALAVALGAFGLAVGANVHSLSVTPTAQQRTLLRASLAIWPIMVAPPAFLVALAAGAVLAWLRGTRDRSR